MERRAYSLKIGPGGFPGGLTREICELYLERNNRVAGAHCDACGTSTSAEVKLLKCTKCLNKAYCCRACQVKDWTEGRHKASCRPPKDFRPQDIVRYGPGR